MYNGLPRICRAPRHALQLTCPAAARTAQTQSSIALRRSLQTAQKPANKRKRPTQATATAASTPPPHVSSPPSSFPRTQKWARRLAWTGAVLGGIYIADTQWNNAAVTRSMRTFKTGLVIGVDYKINFRADPPFAESLAEVHNRNAERVFNLLRENGGLYLKIGQAIAMQSAILPPEFQKMFARMFDDAPQNGWEDVERVVREDFGGKGPEEVFGVSFTGEEGKGVMERTARASASVAQVHWARLPDGREVAVKIQKREIAAQVGWDLWAFKVMARVYTWWFDLPLYSLVPYISERLMLETDFENEADNSEKMKQLVENEPRLRGRVYIPKVYRELSSKRVMTAEWIEGTRLWDKEGVTNHWRGGWREGSPGCNGSPLDPPSKEAVSSISHNDPNQEQLKPQRDSWRGTDGKGGLGLSLRDVMTTMVDLFSAQMFLWGIVHCDPHPGNIFVRRLPNGKPEIVLIDHGLYIQMNPDFRHQYALLWKSLMTFDNATIAEIVKGWGIGSPDLFASATLMRPYTGGDNSTSAEIRKGVKGKTEGERAYEMQMKMRAGVKQILTDETKWPRELIFIGRNLRIVQGNNQFLGSPVNRIKITGLWASRALAESRDLPVSERLRNWVKHLKFRFVLLGSDAVWWYAWVKQKLGLGGGMEEEIEAQMKVMAKDMGIELNHGVFEG
ncbi:ABC1 family protein C10F6.14c [Lasiodiplodia hormozganensis]|uniref:ABC1 family protein C10F6.14c n=1 Tax=Lasiodiplodia hormozganensis TaxID=869390 RepID=A0AA39YZQ7_9PEZI|nr:ABC1 family protein C10F6.14c [Lasiodiplodia hormozganensis]